ncbi:MAG: hypothetical protein KDA91_17125 [Planctomycetaceae bacterium]|nr:hypothetical protein [Planctomycetaceae bacterium]
MSVDSGGYSPSASKPEHVVADWLKSELPIHLKDVPPVSMVDLSAVHSRQYIDGILQGQLKNGHGNTIRRVSRSCLLTAGSFVAAAEEAAHNGKVACSPTSGFHHARYDSARGFCTFNGLMVAAARMCLRKWTVAIIDCDAHQGDGTQSIINQKKMHNQVFHWTYGQEIKAAFQWARFERQIRGFIDSYLSQSRENSRIVFYQAGADAHIDDPLGPGELGMYDHEMRKRDRLIFELCRNHNLPVVWNLAGGYQRDQFGDIHKVLMLHRATMEECVRCFIQPDTTLVRTP